MIADRSDKSRFSDLFQTMSLRSRRQALLIEIEPLQGLWQMALGGVGDTSISDIFFNVQKPVLNMHRHSLNNASLICMKMTGDMNPRKNEISASTRAADLVSRSPEDRSVVA